MARNYARKQDLEALRKLGRLRQHSDGRWIFYKIVRKKERRPDIMWDSPIRYTDGAIVSVPRVDRDSMAECSFGLHVFVRRPPKLNKHRWDQRQIIRVLVDPNDVATAPFRLHYNQYKFRVRKLEVLGT